METGLTYILDWNLNGHTLEMGFLWIEKMTWKAKRRLWKSFLQSEFIPTAASEHNSNFSLGLCGYIPELSCHPYIHLDNMKELKFNF